MVKGIIKFAEKAKNIIFADPNLLYKEQRHLVNKPFFFVGNNGKGVLLVHGWTSTPYEVRRLGKYLNESGYTVLGIQLAGHGTVPKDLEDLKWQDWLRDVQNGYMELKKTCDKVYIGGTSIGGNLALLFAKEQKDIAGLVIMATPYKMRFESLGLFFIKIMLKLKKKYRRKFYPPTFGLSTTITRLISYQTYPVASVLQAFEIVREMRKDLAVISQPVLIMQSTHDHIVEKNSMENIYKKVGSEIKKKIYIKKAYHTFISDIKNEHVFEDILRFLEDN
ncbi:MAG: Carboxylesterase [Parcubacteria group bacterium GW2011_GWD2_38_11]|nr:MAG: Carboxylesterase [Parcubacteria group bacterium GW2011_GWD2_38_11]